MRKQFLIQKILTGLLLMIIIIILGILRRSGSGYSLNVLNGIDLPEANGWCTSLPEYLTQTGVPLTLCYDGVIPTEIVEVKLVLSILEAYPEAVFLDVGSNTGFFSLPAAQRGVKVVSVDAVYKNMVFLHKSAVLNGVENHITMVNNAISDVYLSYLAGLDDRYDYGEVKNQMATRMLVAEEVKKGSIKPDGTEVRIYKYKNEPQSTISVDFDNQISSVLLKDVLNFIQENTVIIKMDIEGFECKAFTNYLQDPRKTKFIPYILVEWIFISSDVARKTNCPEYTQLVDGFLKSGYLPFTPKLANIKDLEGNEVTNNVLWKHKSAKEVPYLTELQNSNLTI